MRPSLRPSSRAVILLAIATVSLAGLVGIGGAEPSTNVPGESSTKQLLVNLGRGHLVLDQATIVRELGSGWVLVEAAAELHDLEGLLDMIGAEWDPNTIYELVADPLFEDQWGLENTGQLGGTPDADIDAQSAWALSSGSPSQIIAVIDSGVDLDHPDLVDRIWSNPGEIPGNSIDDDNNGYIDDVEGWDVLDNDSDPDDEYWHGTAVAGTAVASLNGVGVVGVAPQAAVMPIRACSSTCPVSAIVEGIHYAIDNGAQIINLSLGLHSPNRALEDAVAAANAADVLVIAAAGNDGRDNDTWPFYPASIDLPNVVSVAATNRHDDLAVFAGKASNYGAMTVDLAAPGQEIVTTGVGGWTEASGTSFAAPMVAGTAALILDLVPGATPSQVIAGLVGTVDQLATLEATTSSGGRLNAHTALLATMPPTAQAAATPTLGWRPLAVHVDAAESIDPGGAPLTWDWSSGSATASGYEANIVLPEIGIQTVTLTVTDVFGSTATDFAKVLVGEDFVDTRTSIFRLDIAWMSAKGITRGCNPPANNWYCPNGSVTRDQMAAFLTRALDLAPTSTDYFTDDDGSIFEPDINSLAAAGITKGCNPPTNDQFCPSQVVSRGEMAAFMRRADS
jgi:subtilisin family serine protease